MVGREIDLPPVWLAGFAAAGGVIGWLVPVHIPHGATLGGGLVAAGLALMVLAILQMLLARTTVIPGRDPSRMVTTGLFRLSRNPIYLADAILLAGLYVYWGAALALPLVGLFMYLIFRRFIRDEEARLVALFGPEFEDYKNRTRRWI